MLRNGDSKSNRGSGTGADAVLLGLAILGVFAGEDDEAVAPAEAICSLGFTDLASLEAAPLAVSFADGPEAARRAFRNQMRAIAHSETATRATNNLRIDSMRTIQKLGRG